jgi:thioredoxin reductase (NADPH)
VHRIPPPQVRRLMAEDPELADLLLRAFLARRRRIGAGPGARALQLIGSEFDAAATGPLTAADLDGTWDSLRRLPLPFETSVPGVFAAGDVRSASVKRVAAAVGEGAGAVSSVHRAVGVRL